jgi:hypothetical protein
LELSHLSSNTIDTQNGGTFNKKPELESAAGTPERTELLKELPEVAPTLTDSVAGNPQIEEIGLTKNNKVPLSWVMDYLNRNGEEPAVREGFVSLYRAEDSNIPKRDSGEGEEGRFWSPNLSIANEYGDRVYYKDVPKDSVPLTGEDSFG